jgi:hypothetical protein
LFRFSSVFLFRFDARDNVGHVEIPPATPDATTTILVTTTVNAGPDQTANEGATVRLPGASYTSTYDASHLTLTIHWGDGSVETGRLVPGTNGGTIANTHRYADSGAYTVALTLTDPSGTTSQSSAQVMVLNFAPTVKVTGNVSVTSGVAFSADGSFADPGADT